MLNPTVGQERYLCRFGEMTLKSRPVRRQFTQRLLYNVKCALKPLNTKFNIIMEQAYIAVTGNHPETADVLARVFGVTSVVRVQSFILNNLDEIVRTGYELFKDRIQGQSFAVRCHRVGDHPFSSQEVQMALGEALLPHGTVNLSHPDVTCRVELRNQIANFHTSSIPGAGGLPIGSQGKVLCLISGGIDSPVAAWQALKRGLQVHYLFCSLGGPHQIYGPLKTAKHLTDFWSYGYQPRFYTVDFTPLLASFQSLDHRYRNILLKRFFYRAADKLADLYNYDAIVTGEVVGQVSSQTISNLQTISNATQKLVIRPIITQDKLEIMRMAEHIGTMAISEHVPEFCNVAVRRPRTRSHEDDLLNLEQEIAPNLLDDAIAEHTREDLLSLPPVEMPQEHCISKIPDNALIIWLYDTGDPGDHPWRNRDTQSIPMTQIRSRVNTIPSGRPIVVDCAKGHLSKDTAAYLSERGFEAYYFLKSRPNK